MKLIEEAKIGSLVLKNRLIMTAVHTGLPMDRQIDFFKERAGGGVAACTAVMGVDPGGTYKNMTLIDCHSQPEIQELAKQVNKNGAKLIVQLFHCGRNAFEDTLKSSNTFPVGPSPIPSPIYRSTPEEMDEDEINKTIEKFSEAAKICKSSGVDAVEISCSAGYLLSQFFSPLTNERADNFGGDFEKRCKFPIGVIIAIRNAVGWDYPVILRVSAEDMLDGYSIDDTMNLIKRAEKYIDAVNVTGGWHESPIPQISMHLPPAGFTHYSKKIRDSVKIPVIACNRINDFNVAQKVLKGSKADFIGGAREYICDPHFANKQIERKPFKKCIACNKGCIENVLKNKQVGCILNPWIGREKEFEDLGKFKNTDKKNKKIVVIGGGPAGLELAKTKALEGYDVTLYEKSGRLGGMLNVAVRTPYKDSLSNYVESIEHDLNDLGVHINKGFVIHGWNVARRCKDAEMIFVATGGSSFVPHIAGLEECSYFTATDVLNMDKDEIIEKMGLDVAIIGGGSVGLETALYLAHITSKPKWEKRFKLIHINKEKTIIKSAFNINILEGESNAGKGLSGTKRTTLKEIQRHGINLLTNSIVESIEPVESTEEVNINIAGGLTIPVDTIILATGFKPDLKILTSIKKHGLPYKIIGDAKEISNIGNATKQNDIFD